MSYQVTIQPSGQRISVNEGETVLAAVLRQGFAIPYSCRGGTCGSCMGKIVSGTVVYPDGEPDALSEVEAAIGQALFCQAVPTSNLEIEVREIRSAGEIQPRRLPCRVVKADNLNHDVRRLLLKTPGTERLQFMAGQYIDILLKDGRRRSFSLANAPHDDEFLELHIRLVAGGEFTHYAFTELKEGALLRFEGPLGQFYLREDSPRPILMVCGGTGFAPLKALVEHAFYLGIERPIHLYRGVRARRDLYLEELPQSWEATHPNFRYVPVLSDPAPEDAWSGRTGLVHLAALADHPDIAGYDVYMSGPPALIRAARDDFSARGLDLNHLYYDSFEFNSAAGHRTR